MCVCVGGCYFNAKIYFTKEKEAAFLIAEKGRKECLSIFRILVSHTNTTQLQANELRV